MKTQIRKSIFETNSSSMHAIVVTNKPINKDSLKYMTLEFTTSEFGWNHTTYYSPYDKASYLWTAIVHNFIKEYVRPEYDKKTFEKIKGGYIILDIENPKYIAIREAIRKALVHTGLEDDGIDIRFQENFNDDIYGPQDGGYIDHCPGLDFIESLVFDEDRLLRFLFNDRSYITTWNDNEWYIDNEDEVDEDLDEKYWDSEAEEYSNDYWEKRDFIYLGVNPDDPNIEWKYLKSN